MSLLCFLTAPAAAVYAVFAGLAAAHAGGDGRRLTVVYKVFLSESTLCQTCVRLGQTSKLPIVASQIARAA